MKHGPVALIDENIPVVVLAPSDDVFEEVRSRGGQVIAFVTDADRKLEGKANYLYRVPGTVPCLTPVLMAVPLQLLAYKVAFLRGSDGGAGVHGAGFPVIGFDKDAEKIERLSASPSPARGLAGTAYPSARYLTWKARKYDFSTRFIELAEEIRKAA
jgi:hypothetical protein